MISRRLLRIKTLQLLYAFYRGEDSSIEKTEKELALSIRKGYDLYHYLFLLLIEVRDYAERRIAIARQKHIKTPEDQNPNTRFLDNRIIKLLEENSSLKTYQANQKLSWANYPDLIKKLYQKLIVSPYYTKYMEADTNSFDADRQIALQILNKELMGFEDFEQYLEDQSIYWNDDLEFMVGMAVKTLKGFKESQAEDTPLLPMYSNPEDEDFARRLLLRVVNNHSECMKIIDTYTQNWDIDRIASMDTIIMGMAITEILDFPSIPVRVSFNEYIEISKYYSTQQSSVFINGVLDKIIQHLREENKIQKQGRGLIGEK